MQSELDNPKEAVPVVIESVTESIESVTESIESVTESTPVEKEPEVPVEVEVEAEADGRVDVVTPVEKEPQKKTRLLFWGTSTIEVEAEAEADGRVDVATPVEKEPESKQPMAYELLLKIVRSRLPSHLTVATITSKLVQIITECVKFLATVKTMSGNEKKQLAIQAIKDVITERFSVADSHQVLSVIDAIGEPIIDELVSLGYNTYLFVKSKLSSIKCCLCKSKTQEVEIPKEKIIELSKFVDANLQRPFTQAKVIKLIVASMKYMQSSANSKYFGAAKKDVVLRVVRLVIEQSDKLKNSDRLELTNILDLIGDDFINTAVAFGKDVKTFKA